MNQRLYVQVEPSVSDNIVICIPTKGDTPDYSAIYITKLTPLGSSRKFFIHGEKVNVLPVIGGAILNIRWDGSLINSLDIPDRAWVIRSRHLDNEQSEIYDYKILSDRDFKSAYTIV